MSLAVEFRAVSKRFGQVEVLHGVEGVSFTFFEARDVVRHPLVSRIVSAYDRRDADDAGTGPA